MSTTSTEGFRIVGAQNTMPSSREIDQIIIDHIAVMLKQEKGQYAPMFDYLSINRDSQNNNEHVNEAWRRKICEWSFEVVDHFGFDREVVSIAMNYLDRVIAHTTGTTKALVPRKEFQLVAVTSLYLAIKLHGETDAVEGSPRKLRINAFVELSRGMFSIETLETMERAILSNLEWNVNPPTTVCFVASLLRLLPETWDDQPLHASVACSIFELARYLAELSVCVSTFSFQFKASVISYSALLCAIDALRESVPLPYGARIALLNALAEHTSLTPGNLSVRKCCYMIMELCPSLFTQPEVPEPTGGITRSSSISSAPGNDITPPEEARTSPVCVDQVFKEEFTHRKRVRTTSAE